MESIVSESKKTKKRKNIYVDMLDYVVYNGNVTIWDMDFVWLVRINHSSWRQAKRMERFIFFECANFVNKNVDINSLKTDCFLY